MEGSRGTAISQFGNRLETSDGGTSWSDVTPYSWRPARWYYAALLAGAIGMVLLLITLSARY